MGKEDRYLLPEIVDPERVCLTIYIPNERNHRAAFWGALRELTFWWNWERDEAHTASPVASVWNDVVEDAFQRFLQDECAVVDCTNIADCIQNDPAFLLTLQQLVDNATRNVVPDPEAPMPNARQEINLMPETAGCDRDILFTIVTGLVDGIHQACMDFLEIIELITDPAEIAGELTDNAGIFTAGASSALDIANWLQDHIQTQYEASYTTGVRDALRCALFCNAKEGCSLSMNDIFSVYQAMSGAALQNFGSFDDAIATLISVTGGSDLIIVALFHLLIVSILRYGSDWMNLSDFNGLALIMALAANNPGDPDHEILCTTCVDLFWEHTADFAANLFGYEVVTGQYLAGAVKGVTVNVDERRAVVRLQLPETIKVRACEIDFHVTQAAGAQNNTVSVRMRPIIGSDAGSNLIITTNYGIAAGPHRICSVRQLPLGTFLCREIVWTLNVGSNVNNQADCFMDKIRLWGETSPTPPNGKDVPQQPQCTP